MTGNKPDTGAERQQVESNDGPPDPQGQEAHHGQADPQGPSRRGVHKMFDRIAGRYDLLNHLLSANIDKRWRRKVAALLPPGDNLAVLDLAAGTGDQLISLHDSGRVAEGIGIDLADRMLEIGREKIKSLGLSDKLSLEHGDAQEIPYPDGRFDATTISFGIRNMTDVPRALAEMRRVLKPGGRSLILEFSLPPARLVRGPYLFYLRRILPKLGAAISGDGSAYRYLNETIETFPHGLLFCDLMRKVGFEDVDHKRLSFGVATIYWGDRK